LIVILEDINILLSSHFSVKLVLYWKLSLL